MAANQNVKISPDAFYEPTLRPTPRLAAHARLGTDPFKGTRNTVSFVLSLSLLRRYCLFIYFIVYIYVAIIV